MTNANIHSSPMSSIADQVLRAAAEVEAAETAIKSELFRAARAGEWDRVLTVISRWMTEPATTVLESPEHRLIDGAESR